ncbi:site-specific integrase [Pseudomonas aeruginosa]|nr:site-specific integrase [Pseudomonas aeruginosa]
MINTSDLPILQGEDTLARTAEILQHLAHCALDTEVHFGKANPERIANLQVRHRLALPIFLRLRKGRAFTEVELLTLYSLCITSDAQIDFAGGLYADLVGKTALSTNDVSGLRVPIRAMFVQLWSEGKVTLPHTFNVNGVWLKYPELVPLSEGFIYSVATACANRRASRVFQYHVNWHNPRDVDFEELWEKAPLVVDLQLSLNSKSKARSNLDFSYLSWIHSFAKLHPDIITPEQARVLEAYHRHLSVSHVEASHEELRKTYSEFVQYWISSSAEMSRTEICQRSRERYKDGTDGRKKKKREKLESKRLRSEADIKNALLLMSAEEYALLPGRKSRANDNYHWVEGYYKTELSPDIESNLARWVRVCNIHLDFVKAKLGASSRGAEVSSVRILLDYLGIYLPAWLLKHPSTTVEFPKCIEEFHRSIFWVRTQKNQTIYKNQESGAEIPLPLTLMEFYDLKRSKKTKMRFISSVHRFFELAILNGKEVMPDGFPLVDSMFRNPVNPTLDSEGSGSRSKSDKIPLPIDSMPLVEAYVFALDAIGVELQKKCIDGALSWEEIQEIKNSEWIDLKKCGISYTIKLCNPVDISEIIEIPLEKVINAYSWKHDRYCSKEDYVYVPWLSELRMLVVSLFSGLRLQNSQWLDIRSFDKYYDGSFRGSLTSCILFVNTDKNGNSRPVSLPYRVMDLLHLEKDFQLNCYRSEYTDVHYENDPEAGNKYGLIHPLFRSPWFGGAAPFSDSSYSIKWILILRGFQDLYNSFVPVDRRHEFVERSESGKWLAVHTPHALRATWITHRRIYAGLDHAIIGEQVAHANEYTTDHYTVITEAESILLIEAANKRVSQQAFSALMGRPACPSSDSSALVKGWRQDVERTIRDQHLISVIPEILEVDETGVDIFARTKTQSVKFMEFCMCALNGDCPKKLLDFTRKFQTCGICPYAVFGVDHLPGLNAKIRNLADQNDSLKLKYQKILQSQPQSLAVQEVYKDLSLVSLELAGYRQADQILQKILNDEVLSDGYISRHRDISKALRHSVDMSDPKQRIVSNIIDSSQFPGFCSEYYPLILEEMASNPEFEQVVNQNTDQRDVYVGQIFSIMRAMGMTFAEVSRRALSRPSSLSLDHDSLRA